MRISSLNTYTPAITQFGIASAVVSAPSRIERSRNRKSLTGLLKSGLSYARRWVVSKASIGSAKRELRGMRIELAVGPDDATRVYDSEGALLLHITPSRKGTGLIDIYRGDVMPDYPKLGKLIAALTPKDLLKAITFVEKKGLHVVAASPIKPRHIERFLSPKFSLDESPYDGDGADLRRNRGTTQPVNTNVSPSQPIIASPYDQDI